jgi:hypothetical protein
MKALSRLSILVALLCAATMAAAAGPDRPNGVQASDWVPISARLGIVLVHSKNAPVTGAPQALLLRPPANGYFMVKGADGWSRLVIVEPPKGPGEAG